MHPAVLPCKGISQLIPLQGSTATRSDTVWSECLIIRKGKEMKSKKELDRYYRLEDLETRLQELSARFAGKLRADAIAAAREAIADAEERRRSINHEIDVEINDLRRWVGMRSATTTEEDRVYAERVAAELKAQRERKAAEKAAKRGRIGKLSSERHKKKRLAAVRDGDYTKTLSSQVADEAEVSLAHTAMMLDIFVMKGMATQGYRLRAIDQRFGLDRINADILSGAAKK